MSVDVAEARREIETRNDAVKQELARRHLRDFTAYTMPSFQFEWYHDVIFEKLERIEQGKLRKLMIYLHPRLGKSEIVSKRLPAYILGKYPHKKIICASHTAEFAANFGRKTRTIVKSPEFKSIFPEFRLSDDKSTAGDWETTKEGGYYSAGVGGAIIGRGLNLGIIDDPIKPLAADTPIPTLDGWKKMGDLKIGDKVFDHAGRPTNVVGITQRYKAKRHRVRFSDNSFIDAHPDHLWMAFDRRSHDVYTNSFKDYEEDWWKWKTRGKSSAKQVTTKEIKQSLIARKTMRNWTIPNALPLKLPKANLPIDPYIFGYWLGDGAKRDSTFTVHENDLSSFLNYVEAADYYILSDKIKKDTNTHTLNISTVPAKGNRWGKDCLLKRLRKLGVRNNKHIPKIYLRANYEQRLALLRGLMDSDGTTEYKYGEATFVNTNKKIAEGVQELIISLGGKVVMSSKIPKAQWGDNNKRVYILRGFFPFQAFGLPRKAKSYNESGQIRRVNRTIVDVEVLEETEHLCITVDSESHLFLAGKSMIPTCNSRSDAESIVYRERLWDWYKADFYSRCDPQDYAIVLMHQRWHDDDLAGRLIEEEGVVEEGGEWEVLSFPAIEDGRKKGKYLSSKRGFGEEFYEERRKFMSVRDFASMYQQDPIAAGSETFKKQDFRYFAMSDIKPENFTFAIIIDPAWSTKKESDDTAIAVIAKHKQSGELYVIDIFGDTILPSEAYKLVLSWVVKWQTAQWTLSFLSVEEVSLSRDQQEFVKGFEREMREQKRFYMLLPFKPVGMGKKEDRIRFSLEPMFNRNALHFRNDDTVNPAWKKLEEQLLRFPASRKKDLVDVLSQGVIMWNERGNPIFEEIRKKKKKKREARFANKVAGGMGMRQY